MADQKTLLELLKIKPGYVAPDVDRNLSTIRSILSIPEYRMGNFLTRLFKRFLLVDEFRGDHIAYATYNSTIRKVTININPFMLWDRVLRETLVIENLAKTTILEIDKVMVESYKAGGWNGERYAKWQEFLVEATNFKQESSFKTCILSIFIHEVLHAAWNHLTDGRKDDSDKQMTLFGVGLANIAMDFAINQTLSFGCINSTFMTKDNEDLLQIFKDGGAKMATGPIRRRERDSAKKICVEDFDELTFLNQPYEYYLNLLKNTPPENIKKLVKKSIRKSSMFGKLSAEELYNLFKHGLTPEDIQSISGGGGEDQFEDFNQATSDMKKVMENDLRRVIDEMLAKGEIQDATDVCNQHPFSLNKYFARLIEGLYHVTTFSWEQILASYLKGCVGADEMSYTLKRESRPSPGFFPGKERLETLDLVLIMDVSGSINFEDYNRFIAEIEKIAQTVDMPEVRYLQFHSTVSMDVVTPLHRVRSLGVPSTGGTDLKKPLDLLKDDDNRKLTVVFTDGAVDEDFKQSDYDYPIIMFLSASGSEYLANKLRSRKFVTIHQDGDNSWFVE